MKYDYETLTEFCKEHNILLCEDYSNVSLKRETFITGICETENCNNTFTKGFRALLNPNGYCPSCAKNVGKEKAKKTNLEKYGVEFTTQSNDVKNKIKQTCLKKYGVENPSQNPDIKNKKIQTSLKNWGVEYPSQNAEVSEKINNNLCKTKTYTLPSGKIIKCQGYEPFAFRDLLNLNINENDIINKRTEVPKIWFIDNNNKKRRYYVDIFIPSQNKCIEVKSWYIYKKNENKNLLKKQAALDLGYNFEFWIYDTKGNRQYNLENI